MRESILAKNLKHRSRACLAVLLQNTSSIETVFEEKLSL